MIHFSKNLTKYNDFLGPFKCFLTLAFLLIYYGWIESKYWAVVSWNILRNYVHILYLVIIYEVGGPPMGVEPRESTLF